MKRNEFLFMALDSRHVEYSTRIETLYVKLQERKKMTIHKIEQLGTAQKLRIMADLLELVEEIRNGKCDDNDSIHKSLLAIIEVNALDEE